jgi:hypothetical protein
MTETIKNLEQDIAQTRARLDETIDQLQDRLSVSGIVDDLMGTVRASDRFGPTYDHAADVVRRNPLPVILLAVGAGWLLYRLGKERDARRLASSASARVRVYEDAEVPVMTAVDVRTYDPDVSPRHPGHDTLESRRELSAQA